jgi:hypothetical protein
MAQIGMDQLANEIGADIEAQFAAIDQHTDKATAELSTLLALLMANRLITDSPSYLSSTLDNNQ